MIYITSFFQRFYPDLIHIDFNQLDTINQADAVAVDFYNSDLNQHTNKINKLLDSTKQLHLYLGEPTNDQEFTRFIHTFDRPNVHIYSDCVLNFSLSQAKFKPTINWFIDPVNYYTEYTWAKKLLTKLDYSTNKPYCFDILLGQEKPHRTKVNELVETSQYKDQFVHSYFKQNLVNGIFWDQHICPGAHSLTSESFRIGNEDARVSALLPVDIYNQSYYSVVCETTAYNSYNQYTEKVAKPILAKRPFIVFAGQYYLKNLKSLGFETFDICIDESYDLEPDQQRRFAMAWRQVEQLCDQDPAFVLDQLAPILARNQYHFLNTDWANPIKHLF